MTDDIDQPHRVDFFAPDRPVEGCTIYVLGEPELEADD